MKLIKPTDQDIKDLTNKAENKELILPEPKRLINLDQEEYQRQISDVVLKWVLAKTQSWQERVRIIIDEENKDNKKLWCI